jgi:hypothetical protein
MRKRRALLDGFVRIRDFAQCSEVSRHGPLWNRGQSTSPSCRNIQTPAVHFPASQPSQARLKTALANFSIQLSPLWKRTCNHRIQSTRFLEQFMLDCSPTCDHVSVNSPLSGCSEGTRNRAVANRRVRDEPQFPGSTGHPRGLSENRRVLAHFAGSSEQNAPRSLRQRFLDKL